MPLADGFDIVHSDDRLDRLERTRRRGVRADECSHDRPGMTQSQTRSATSDNDGERMIDTLTEDASGHLIDVLPALRVDEPSSFVDGRPTSSVILCSCVLGLNV